VPPAELEGILLDHPSIADCAVVGRSVCVLIRVTSLTSACSLLSISHTLMCVCVCVYVCGCVGVGVFSVRVMPQPR
jgi:hypothetical protein